MDLEGGGVGGGGGGGVGGGGLESATDTAWVTTSRL